MKFARVSDVTMQITSRTKAMKGKKHTNSPISQFPQSIQDKGARGCRQTHGSDLLCDLPKPLGQMLGGPLKPLILMTEYKACAKPR